MSKTYKELFEQVKADYGVVTDSIYHVDLNKKITDSEYKKKLEFYSTIPSVFDDVFNKKFQEDDFNDDL